MKKVFIFFFIIAMIFSLKSKADISISTVTVEQIDIMNRENAVPLIISQYHSIMLSNLFTSIQKITGDDTGESLNVPFEIIQNTPNKMFCNEPMILSLGFKYMLIIEQFNKQKFTETKSKLSSHLDKHCPNYLLYIALSEKKNRINNIYKYIESLISIKTELADTIKNKEYVDDEITELASEYFNNTTYKGLLQTYLLTTFIKNKDYILNKKSLALALFILADFYSESGDEFKYRMVTWTVVPYLQTMNVIPEYIVRVNSDIFFK